MISLTAAVLLLFLTGIYGVFTFWLYQGLGKLQKAEMLSEEKLPTVSVIVPARNEDHNLEETLESLAAQDYPREKMQVVMVNDRSHDQTPRIMNKFARKYDNFLKIDITELPERLSPKKNAIEWGITVSNGEIILTTDADCVHSRNWIRTMVSHFKPDVGIVAGLTLFEPDDESIWHKLHSLDYISHSFIGAGAIGNGSALNCTGANLAYRYETFMSLGGYGDKIHMVSGDDEFLLQKVVNSGRWKAAYALGQASIVKSLPPETLKEILQQRIRWGSKGLYYPPPVTRLSIAVFIFFTILVLAPLLIIAGVLPWWALCAAFLVKLRSDYKVMKRGYKLFQIKFPLLRFGALLIIHPFIIAVSAAGGHLIPFRWKGQRFRPKV